jgi:hypothetical protein
VRLDKSGVFYYLFQLFSIREEGKMEKTMRKGRALRMVHGRHRHWKQRGIWIGLLLAATSILGEVEPMKSF